MAPDPPLYPVDESVSHNYDAAFAMHNSDDSGSEVEEQTAYDGYTLLGQTEIIGESVDYNTIIDNETVSVNESNESSTFQELQQGGADTSPTAGRAELVALWNSTPEASSNSIAIDDERSAEIKAAMAGFSLPPSAVPAWASSIPEELWKEKLLDRLQQNVLPQSLPGQDSTHRSNQMRQFQLDVMSIHQKHA